MKRKTMALMLALSMCLSLLSACGSGNTATDDKPPESENVVSSTEQPEESEKPEESKEQPEESEEPKEEEPEKLEEPIQEEPKEENNAGTAFLKLLQEEYKNGFVEGERPGCTYYASSDECSVEKIIVHEGDKSSGHRIQKIEIYYSFVGDLESSHVVAQRTRKTPAA